MTDSIYTETYKGLTIEIFPDDVGVENPFHAWDCLGTFVNFHSRYGIGSENPGGSAQDWLEKEIGLHDDAYDRLYDTARAKTQDLISDHARAADRYYTDSLFELFERDNIVLPVYMYDHSGITISTGPFSCQWDSGQVGFIYVSKARIRQEYGVKRISKKTREKVLSCLRAEIQACDDYLTGNVYGFQVQNRLGDCLDSCWGFFGDYDSKGGALDNARETADYIIKTTAEKPASCRW